MSVKRYLKVWDDRDHNYIAGDVRIEQTMHDLDSHGIVAEQEITLEWEQAWDLYEALRYVLNDGETRQDMRDSGFDVSLVNV